MSEVKHVPLLIVGGGPAGLTAGIYARRAGIDCEIVERAVHGGQVFIADKIENYPGFPEPINGGDLSDSMKAQAERFGTKFIFDEVKEIKTDGDLKKVNLERGGEITCDALIAATRCIPNKLGVSGEGKLWGRGVSYCATCDGNFFRDQEIAVIGGGDSACQEAHMLSHLASKVHIIHRRDQFRAQDYLAKSVLERPNIEVIWDTVAESMNGELDLGSISLKNIKTEDKSELNVQGVFIYVGMNPITDFLEGLIDLDNEGYVIAGEDTRTSVPGIYAAGDARVKGVRQIVTAVADGACAVRAVEIYFIERGISSNYV